MNAPKQYQSSRILNRSIIPATLIFLTLLAWLWLTSPVRVTGAQSTLASSATGELTVTPTPSVHLVIASSFGANMLECPRVDCETVASLEYGTELELIDSEIGWFNVRAADGSTGFVPDFVVTILAEATPTLTPPPTATGCASPAGWSTYIVQTGDTLANIARRAGTSPEQLVQANCLLDANLIFPGQSLLVPSALPTRLVIPTNVPARTPPGSTIVVPQNTLVSPTNIAPPPINGRPRPIPTQTIVIPQITTFPTGVAVLPTDDVGK